MKRKSAVDLTDLAIGVLILGITVSIGARMLVTFKDNQITNTDTGSVNDETLTTVTEAGETLGVAWVSSVDTCVNTTDDLIASGNYTTSISGFGLATVSSSSTVDANFNNTDWDCNYTVYNTSDARYSLPNDASIGLAEYGNWFDIIVIVGIAGLILGLIFLAFGRSGGTSEVSY